jgi:hypothetical protein
VNPRQATLGVELSLTLVPKSTKTHGYASSRESPRERRSVTSDPFPTKPPRGFVPPKQEVRKGVSRGITSSNIIEGKYNRKAMFTFEHLFLDLTIEPGPRFYTSFLAGIIYKKLKLRIRDLLALPKKSRELKTYPYEARFKEEQKIEYDIL